MNASMLAELRIFYKDKFSGALLCTLACSIHILSVFTIIISSFAIIADCSPYEILTTVHLFTVAVILSFSLLGAAVLGAIKLVPLSQVKLINQYREQQWFIIAWMSVNNALLIYVVSSFSNTEYPAHLSGNQAAIALAAIISLYIILFLALKTSAILGYREKSKMLDFMSPKLIYSEDVDEFIQNYARINILKLYENGQSEFTAEYRRLLADNEYVWVRAIVNLVKDIETDDIKAFVCIKNIDIEKKKQLELQRLAYQVKNGGKNSYRIYNGNDFKGYTSQRTEIQTIGNLSQKGFRQNRIEYIFKMLYHSEKPVAAIHSALELVANHFSFERGYIFETSKDGSTTSNTFEWCAEGITPEMDNLQELPLEVVSNAHASFRESGMFIMKSLDDVPPMEQAVLEPQGIKSMLQFGIFDKNQLLGFIGFDNCRGEAILYDTEIDEIATICNILATFFVKHYIDETASSNLLARQEVMDHLDSYIYVIHTETFKVLYMNNKILKFMKEETSRSACYIFFRGEKAQCVDCPLKDLRAGGTKRVVREIYNKKLKIWMEVTASALRWTDGSLAYLINCTDITMQKEAYQQHIRQLERLAYVDELTGCRTYYKFKEDAQCILERQQDLSHFLVKLDIENFRLINQVYGYEKGNEILCYVAKAIGKTTRNENEIFARVTNDEFIALFTINDQSDIELLYEKFLQSFHSFIGSDFAFKCNFPHGRYVIDPSNKKRWI